MDVISMFQSGIENVVASGGTALTKPQIRLIRRFTSNITVLYDGDAAGIHAALRGIDMFLEEGFNVKVVLLSDGEDPDSFAQSHDSTEFIRYIEEHQTDFIRFKSALLSKDAGDDPFKRAELIKDITSSISVIPDMITRQVYIKDTAERLHMSEKVLTTEVVKLRRKLVEEKTKVQEGEKREEEKAGAPIASKPVTQVAPKAPKDGLEANYYNLMQLIVRYGERPIEVEGTVYSIGEVIIYTLEGDEIAPPQPVYQTIIDEFKRHSKEPNFKAEQFYKFHPEPAVSAMAIDMIADKYQMGAPKEDARLGELVTQLLYEMKLTVINMQIAELEAGLKDAQEKNDVDQQMLLLSHHPQLLAQRNEICKRLGNRIINL
jgi:DNA primase